MSIVRIKYLIDPDKEIYERKIVIITLPINLNMCCERSKEPSHCEGSFEYSQLMFWLKFKKIIFQYILLSVGLLTFSIPFRKIKENHSEICPLI